MSIESLAGCTAIVTGASRGIGLGIAEALLARGARVVLTGRSSDAAEAAAASLGSDRAAGFGAHVGDEQAARQCMRFTLDHFGSLDVLVNNAGTNPAFGPVLEQDKGQFMKTLDTNLWAPVMWTGLAWRAWMRVHGGAVVNIASVGGLAVSPDLGVYHASKAALIHVTKQMALEMGPMVRVNAVAPGVVRTRLSEALWREQEGAVSAATPLGRIGEPSDVGGAVAFLVSDAAGWITGDTLIIDGGRLLGPPQPKRSRTTRLMSHIARASHRPSPVDGLFAGRGASPSFRGRQSGKQALALSVGSDHDRLTEHPDRHEPSIPTRRSPRRTAASE